MDREQYPEIGANIIKYRGSLFSFIFSFVRDFNDAEDIFQDTCVVIWSKADTFEPDSNFLAWARAIAVRKIKEMYRSKAHAADVLTPELIEVVSHTWSSRWSDGEQEQDAYEERRRSLHECMKLLKGKAHDVAIGFYERGMSCGDIARAHGKSTPAVHMLLKRIREKLFSCVQARLKGSA